MNNKYIYYTNIDFDLEKLQEIVERNFNTRIPGMASHHRRVNDEPYLVELQKQYSFLSSVYNIYITKPEYITPIHIDSGRQCAVNIPIFYTEDSYTIFYESLSKKHTTYIKERIYDVVDKEDSIEVFRFTLDRPTLINAKIPHNVTGGPKQARTILSWSVKPEFDYETIKSLLVSM